MHITEADLAAHLEYTRNCQYTVTFGTSGLPNSDWPKSTLARAMIFAEKMWEWKKITFMRVTDREGKIIREVFR
jgi:hypothetical protein